MRFRLSLVCLALALAAPSAAHAAQPSVVDFNALAPNTVVTDQYAASQNIVFGSPSTYIEGFPTYSGCGSDSNDAPTVEDTAGARVGELTCSADEISKAYETAIHTDIERRGVSFTLRGAGLRDDTVTVAFYNAGTVGGGPSVIGTQTLHVAGNAVVPVSLTRPGTTQDIVTVVIRAVGSPTSDLLLDDISMLKDDTPPPRKFSFSLGRPTADLVEGSSVDAPINLQRYNGSAGAVTFSVGALPPGIGAAQVNPNPVTGTNPPNLRVSAQLPFAGDRQISVGASGTAGAGTFIGGGRLQTVHGLPAIVAGDGGVARPGAQTSLVSGCGDKQAEYPITVRGDFSGYVDVSVEKNDGPVTVLDNFTRLNAAGNGTLVFPYGLRQALGSHGGSTLTLRFRPQNGTPVEATVRVFEYTFTIDSISGAYSYLGDNAAEFLSGTSFGSSSRSDELSLKGSFPTGCNPNFLDDANRPIDEISKVQSSSGGLDTYRLKLPYPPTTTTVRAMGPGNVELARSKTLQVTGYRNGPALSAVNGGENAGSTTYSWGDFLHDFGSDDGDACSPFECHRDPFALQSFDNIRDVLRAGKGLCFGYDTQSILFATQGDLPSLYAPAPISGWQLPFFEGSKIKDEVVRWQVSQYDGDWTDYTKDLAKDVPTFEQFRQHLRDALSRRDQTVIAIRNGKNGHAVTAYDMREEPNGTLDILTYNPNKPYTLKEQTDNATRNDATTRSTIFVTPSGQWRGGIFPGGNVNAPWTGNLSSIEIYDRLPPGDADLPFGFFTESLDSAVGTAEVSSIKVGGTEALKPNGTSVPGTGVSDLIRLAGPNSPIDYRLARGHAYDITVTGQGRGVFGDGVLGGRAGADVQGLRTKPGQHDHITLTPGVAGLKLTPGGAASPATIKLLARAGKRATRTADLRLAARHGATEDASLTGGALNLRHTGPATDVSVTLGAVGLGAPGAVSTRAIRVGPGGRLTLAPRSWSDLGAGVRLTIRDAKGRVVRRGRAALRATKVVHLGRATARVTRAGRHRQVIVTGRIAKLGRSPLLVAVVKVMRGRRTLSTTGASRRGAKVKRGAFRLPVNLKSLPAGAKVRVTVSLVDEAAGFASVRRVLGAR